MSQRGKNKRDDYTALGVRIPKALKRRLAAKLAFYDDLNTSTAVERLLELWVTGQVEIGVPADAPQDVYNAVHNAPQAIQAEKLEQWQPIVKKSRPRKRQAVESSAPRADKGAASEFANIRKQLDLSQRDYSRALAISQSSVGNYERGKVLLPVEVLERARALLGEGTGEG